MKSIAMLAVAGLAAAASAQPVAVVTVTNLGPSVLTPGQSFTVNVSVTSADSTIFDIFAYDILLNGFAGFATFTGFEQVGGGVGIDSGSQQLGTDGSRLPGLFGVGLSGPQLFALPPAGPAGDLVIFQDAAQFDADGNLTGLFNATFTVNDDAAAGFFTIGAQEGLALAPFVGFSSVRTPAAVPGLSAASAYIVQVVGATVEVVPIPTPGSLALLGLGGLAAARRRR